MRPLLIPLCLTLAGCVTTDPGEISAAAGPLPADYKAQIVASARQSYFDPYSIRAAQIGTPERAGQIPLKGVWVVCVRSNAKNRMGAYTGIQDSQYHFNSGRLVFHGSGCVREQAYHPFPELGDPT